MPTDPDSLAAYSQSAPRTRGSTSARTPTMDFSQYEKWPLAKREAIAKRMNYSMKELDEYVREDRELGKALVSNLNENVRKNRLTS